MEKKVRAIILDEEEFRDAINSDRLRFESLRTLGGFDTGDINLNGTKAAKDNIHAECPVSNPQKTVQEAKSTPQEIKPEFCVQPMRDKLGGEGVTARQIKQVGCEASLTARIVQELDFSNRFEANGVRFCPAKSCYSQAMHPTHAIFHSRHIFQAKRTQ